MSVASDLQHSVLAVEAWLCVWAASSPVALVSWTAVVSEREMLNSLFYTLLEAQGGH